MAYLLCDFASLSFTVFTCKTDFTRAMAPWVVRILHNTLEHSAVHPAPREGLINGSPIDRFSKEGQAIGSGQGGLPGKGGLATGLWSLDTLWIDADSLPCHL